MKDVDEPLVTTLTTFLRLPAGTPARVTLKVQELRLRHWVRGAWRDRTTGRNQRAALQKRRKR